MPKKTPEGARLVRVLMPEDLRRDVEAKAATKGMAMGPYIRAVLGEVTDESQNDLERLAAIGFTASERKAVQRRAARAGKSLWDFVKRASLDFVPVESRAVAGNDWRVRIRCSDEQRTEILERAELVGLSPSQYLLKIGLGYEPASRVDHKAVVKLLQTAGDLGRIGGLLKLWLTDRPGEGVPPDDMRRVLNELLEVQHEIRLKARAL